VQRQLTSRHRERSGRSPFVGKDDFEQIAVVSNDFVMDDCHLRQFQAE